MANRIISVLNQSFEDVIPLFRMNTANQKTTDTGNGDNGVFVAVEQGDGNLDFITSVLEANQIGYGESYPTVGFNRAYTCPHTVKPATSGDACLGITITQSAVQDENGEWLLRHPDKARSIGVVPSGSATAILQHGQFMLDDAAFDGNLTPGSKFKISANAGKITGCAVDDARAIGDVLITGTRSAGIFADRYAGTTTSTYAVVRF